MMRNIPKNRKTMEEHGRALREEAQFCMSWFTGKPCSFQRWPDAYGVAMLNGNGALHALNRFTALRRIICSYVILLYSELTPTDKTWPNQKTSWMWKSTSGPVSLSRSHQDWPFHPNLNIIGPFDTGTDRFLAAKKQHAERWSSLLRLMAQAWRFARVKFDVKWIIYPTAF